MAGVNHSRPLLLFKMDEPPDKGDACPPASQILPVQIIAFPDTKRGADPVDPKGPDMALYHVVPFVEYLIED